jgi:putative ATP-dependent endonuclease of OLD family
MFIESVKLCNFKCFGPQAQTVSLAQGLSVFIGSNGTGKTALMQALLRLFGVTNEQRFIRKRDFHIPLNETEKPNTKDLYLEAILAFPELTEEDPEGAVAVPEFFRQMTVDGNGIPKCRIRLEAKWSDDNTAEGAIEQYYYIIRSLENEYTKDQEHKLAATDRGRVQVIYVPAIRDGASQVTAALKGRLWKAISWSEQLRTRHSRVSNLIQSKFQTEIAIDNIKGKLNNRWAEVHSGGTDNEIIFSPVDADFESFIKKVEVSFRPDEDGQNRSLEELSDGQRSLFHIAFTSALIDVENEILKNKGSGFQSDSLYIPALTILAIEEPENNLAPFYLSRIVRQVENIVGGYRAQAVISSHSASTLTRVNPESIRYFRCDASTRHVSIRSITLPDNSTEAGKYVREAVRAYPELYFAKFVILGEGDSELIVLPKLAEALNLIVDPSFVSVVPLGGRHVNHFWQLLNDLEIPHATLLDLDLGRKGGGWGRIKYAGEKLIENKRITLQRSIDAINGIDSSRSNSLDDMEITKSIMALRKYGVYFSAPLDLDMLMLDAFREEYTTLDSGATGPSGDAVKAKKTVLKPEGEPLIYPDSFDDSFKWYRYLFLGRGKPSTHINAMSRSTDEKLQSKMPEPLAALLKHVNAQIVVPTVCDEDI